MTDGSFVRMTHAWREWARKSAGGNEMAFGAWDVGVCLS